MIIIIGERVGCYVQLVYKHFTIFDPGVGILQICPAQSQRFHFGACERQPGLEFVNDKIIAAGFAVLGNDFDVCFCQNCAISFLI